MALRLAEVRQLLVQLAAKVARRAPERRVVQARHRLTLEQRRRLLAQEHRLQRREHRPVEIPLAERVTLGLPVTVPPAPSPPRAPSPTSTN